MSDLSRDYICEDFPTPPPGTAMGLIPRDFNRYPVGSLVGSVPFDLNIPLIPFEEWPDLIADSERNKSRISDIRDQGNNGGSIPSLDQDGQGYCWAYSTTGCIQLLRAINNMPYVALSGHSVGCKVKNFKDEGGWCGLSMEFVIKNGVVPQSLWPAKSMSRSNDTAEAWEAAKAFVVNEGYVDLQAAAYDRNMTWQQVGSCLLAGIPCDGDFNHWGHSVTLMDVVDVYTSKPATDPRRYGVRLLNSWSDNWGERGTGILKDGKHIPDGAVAIRSVVAA